MNNEYDHNAMMISHNVVKEELLKDLEERMKIYYKFRKYIKMNQCTISEEEQFDLKDL